MNCLLHNYNIIEAYIDPGTGSYVFQIIIAGLLGAIVTIKTSWEKIKKVFRKSDHAE